MVVRCDRMVHRSDKQRGRAISADGLRIGLAVSTYHSEITRSLREAAERAFAQAGGAAQDLVAVEVPGAFELIAICRALAERDDIDGIVALGCVIRGETQHDQAIVAAVAHGLSSIIVDTGVPIGFGVLTCENIEQARERAGGAKGNKGEEAMHAAIAAAAAIDALAQEEELA